MTDNFAFGAQFEEPITTETNPFGSRGGETLLERGVFASPNFKRPSAGWQFTPNSAEIYTAIIALGGATVTINNTQDIQENIDFISSTGGGAVYLAPGTYNLKKNIDIPSNVYLIGASRSAVILDFGGLAFGVRSLGVALTHITNILVKDLTIQNSSITGLKLQYNDYSQISGVDVFSCNIGIELDNIDSVAITGMGTLCDLNATGIQITNSTSFSVYFSACTNSTANGLVISDSSSATIFDSAFTGSTADGIRLTNCSFIAFISLVSDTNGGQGVELVSGNSDLQFYDVGASSNTSDGIKLTATSDRVAMSGCTLTSNGGYGINIAAATCDNNIIDSSTFTSNSTAAVNDAGTGTSITGNKGVDDTGRTFSTDVSVPDEAYNATNWNGSLEVPTKNAVRDKIESLSTGGYSTLETQTLGGAATTLTTDSFTTKKFLRIIIYAPAPDTSRAIYFQFNADTGANYTGAANTDHAAATTFFGQTSARTADANSANARLITMDIYDSPSIVKRFVGTVVDGTGGVLNEFSGSWNNTADRITSITVLLSGAGNLAAGTEITVLGMD